MICKQLVVHVLQLDHAIVDILDSHKLFRYGALQIWIRSGDPIFIHFSVALPAFTVLLVRVLMQVHGALFGKLEGDLREVLLAQTFVYRGCGAIVLFTNHRCNVLRRLIPPNLLQRLRVAVLDEIHGRAPRALPIEEVTTDEVAEASWPVL